MAEEINLKNKYSGKEEMYADLLHQIRSVLEGEDDLIANLANIAAIIKTYCSYLWVGFYFVKGTELVLGPFQGPLACTRIGYGKGVCGTSWKEEQTIIVDDVDKYPGHIACSSESRSEIVVPVFNNGEVFLVLDVDSDNLSDFNKSDQDFFEALARLIEELHT